MYSRPILVVDNDPSGLKLVLTLLTKEGYDVRTAIDAGEALTILQTLERTNWNKQEAAHILGLYRPTLYSKMKKHNIQDPKQRRAAV